MTNDQWNRHEQELLKFEQAWGTPAAHDVASVLDALRSDSDAELDLGYLALEMAKIDLERHLKSGEHGRRCEFYLDAIPELSGHQDALAELLAVEIATREAGGDLVADSELDRRFPDQASALRTIVPASTTDRKTSPPRRSAIGPYKLVHQIGEGGMGTVWLAEQIEPVRRRVALKSIKSNVADKQVIARFEAERQALAMMDHPNIAKVLDAGTTDDGVPYIVMELVEGDPITEYCDANRLTPSARLELFTPVCRALHHAHQKGIIHRDLKPSNVLVGVQDGQPIAKVIDFGLAKALQHHQKLTDKTMFTEFGQVLGTLAYMSPEQAQLDSLDVDTRSDIYSLGVILYELLAGSTPLDQDTVRKRAFLQVLELVREQEPPRPSHRLSSSMERLSAISQNRRTESRKLQQILRGDLDWIIMKALEKDRGRRYDSAAGFAQDVERYLNGETVVARPPTVVYRLRKFARKHRTLLGMTALTFVLLTAGLAGTLTFAIKATRSQQAAERSTEEAQTSAKRSQDVLQIVTDAFQSVNPALGADSTMSARDVLLQAQSSLQSSPLDEQGRMLLLKQLTFCFKAIGAYDMALSTAEETVRLGRQLLGARHPETLNQRQWLGQVLVASGRHEDAIREFEESIALFNESRTDQHPDTLEIKNRLAEAHLGAGQYEDAIRVYEETADAQKSLLGEQHLKTLATLNGLALAYHAAGRYTEAVEVFEAVVPQMSAQLDEDHPDLLLSKNNLALVYQAIGRNAEAISLMEGALQRQRRKLGDAHPTTLGSMNNLATTYYSEGRFQDAVPLFEAAFEAAKAQLGMQHPHTMFFLNNLASTYQAMGRFREALESHQKVLELRQEHLGADNPETLVSMNNLALAYQDVGDLPKAIEVYEQVVPLLKSQLGDDHPTTQIVMGNLANAYRLDNRLAEALDLNQQALALKRTTLGESHVNTLTSMNNLADNYQALGRVEEGVAVLKQLVKISEQHYGASNSMTLLGLSNLAFAYQSLADFETAIELGETTVERWRNSPSANDAKMLVAMNNLADNYRRVGRLEESLTLFEETLRLRTAATGIEHESTLSVMSNFAEAYLVADRPEDAIALLEPAVETSRELWGEDDSDTISYVSQLAAAYAGVGRCQEARQLWQDCFARRESLDADSWMTFELMSQLGGVLLQMGEVEQAAQRLLAGYEGLAERSELIPLADRRECLSEALDRLVRLAEVQGNENKKAEWQAKLDALVSSKATSAS